MSCSLLFVRHGQSMGNFSRSFLGHTDLDLSELGFQQAEAVGKFLSQFKIDKIFSSDLKRAYQTALPFANMKNLSIIKSEALREIYAGEWEGMPFSAIAEKYKEAYDIWINDIGHAIPNGGEPVVDVQKRIIDAVTQIALNNDGKTIAVFTHATVIRTFFAFIEGKSIDEMKFLPWPANASICEAVFDGKNFSEISYSRDDYLGELVSKMPKGV